MAAITTRETAGTGATVKNAPLTNTEVDTNFININTDLSNAVYITGDQTIVGTKTLTSPTIISVNSSSNALRITQTGAGNALVVEDSANPDSTPFRINSDGLVLVGGTPIIGGGTSYPQFQVTGYGDGTIGANAAAMAINGFLPSGNGGFFGFNRSNSSTVGINTIVANGDQIGRITWSGADGTNYIRSAQISAEVDGAPGTDSMPGRLILATTLNGGTTPLERVRIDSAGRVGFGGTPYAGTHYYFANNITGATSVDTILQAGTVQSGVTSAANIFTSFTGTAVASFTLSNLRHFSAEQATFGSGSIVTNQVAYSAGASLTGATNNFGFFSNIPDGVTRTITTVARTTNVVTVTTSAAHGYTTGQSVTVTATTNTGINGTFTITGTPTTTTFTYSQTGTNIASVADTGSTKVVGRWNFYANGTADNHFNSRILIGRTYTGNERLGIGGSTSAAGESGIYNDTTIGSATTTAYTAFNSYLSTAVASFTLTNLTHYNANQFTIGAGSTVTNQYGFSAGNLTGATNNFGFYSNVASGTGRWNFYANGTANNYFAGSVFIGNTNTGGTERLYVEQSADNHTARIVNTSTSGTLRGLQIHSTANNIPGVTLSRWYSTFAGNADVGQIRFDGLGTGAGYVEHAAIYATATGVNTATGAPTKLSFKTSDGTSSTEKMAVSATGVVSITATTASTSTTTGALIVAGGVGIAGALNATTKSFIIDHPTKPGKLLKHGSLEGPEFGVYVRGTLCGNVIELPEYWTKLVDPSTITVQLTPIGKHQKLYVKEIKDNKVYIETSEFLSSKPHCYYYVLGERADVDKLKVESE